MIRLLADENLNAAIVNGVRRRRPDVDFMSVQEAGLGGWADPELLEWAAVNGRVMVTHDADTMTRHAAE